VVDRKKSETEEQISKHQQKVMLHRSVFGKQSFGGISGKFTAGDDDSQCYAGSLKKLKITS